MLQLIKRALDYMRDADTPDFADRHDKIAGGNRVLVHLSRIGEARETDLSDVSSRKTIFDERANRVAITQSLIGVTHIEMRVESDEPDLLQRTLEPQHRGSSDGVVSAD